MLCAAIIRAEGARLVPYARNADLPSQVRNALPNAAQTVFRRAVSAALGTGKDEKTAFQIAWAAVSRSFKPGEEGGKWVHKLINSTLYVRRNVENAADIIKWAKGNGFEKAVPPAEMHVTIAYSKTKIDWPEPDDDSLIVKTQSGRSVEPLGDEGAIVLKFRSSSLQRRWQELIDKGASWDYEEYNPHVTITYEGGEVDLEKIAAYDGLIELGPEVFEEVKDGFKDRITEKEMPMSKMEPLSLADVVVDIKKKLDTALEQAAVEKVDPAFVMKVDAKLGLVFGWAIICKNGGEDYYDLQDDHIPEDSMMEAALEFMEKRRTLKLMHKGEKQGSVIFAWPLTTEVAKAMGLKTSVTGLMIAVKPTNKKILKDIASGKLTGFSIGGQRIEDEEIDEEEQD